MESAETLATPAVDPGIAELEATIARVRAAQQAYATFSQEKVDSIFKSAALAANRLRIPLAKMAVEETGMGIVEDKIIKNHYAAEYIYNTYKDTKTCGVVEEDEAAGPYIHRDLQVPPRAQDEERNRHQPPSARQELHDGCG